MKPKNLMKTKSFVRADLVIILTLLLFILFIFPSCSNVKYLPKGQSLYTGSKIKYVGNKIDSIKQKAVLKEELEAIVLPKPNSNILGLRIKLWFYNIAGKPTGKGLRYIIKNKLGEPPVYTSYVNFEKNRSIMVNRLQNRGYFKSMVSVDTTTKNKRTRGLFSVKAGAEYLIDTLNFPKDSGELSKAINATENGSLLIKGQPYDLDVIKAERTRIDTRLKQNGFFFFNENYLLIKVDTNFRNNKINMYLKVKPVTPSEAKFPYRIGDVVIYADYGLATDTAFNKSKATLYDSFYVVDPYKKI